MAAINSATLKVVGIMNGGSAHGFSKYKKPIININGGVFFKAIVRLVIFYGPV